MHVKKTASTAYGHRITSHFLDCLAWNHIPWLCLSVIRVATSASTLSFLTPMVFAVSALPQSVKRPVRLRILQPSFDEYRWKVWYFYWKLLGLYEPNQRYRTGQWLTRKPLARVISSTTFRVSGRLAETQIGDLLAITGDLSRAEITSCGIRKVILISLRIWLIIENNLRAAPVI